MLDFYHNQLEKQDYLVIFLSNFIFSSPMNPHCIPSYLRLTELIETQSNQLRILIKEFQEIGSPSERGLQEYCNHYFEQQKLFGKLFSGELLSDVLPPLTFPQAKQNELVGLLPLLERNANFETSFDLINFFQSPYCESWFFFKESDRQHNNTYSKKEQNERRLNELKTKKEPLSEEEKNKVRCLKKCIAASNSRQKKKETISNLKTKVEKLKNENNELRGLNNLEPKVFTFSNTPCVPSGQELGNDTGSKKNQVEKRLNQLKNKEEPLSEEEKQERRRLYNYLAALEFREKEKKTISNLKLQVENLENENNELRNQKSSLTDSQQISSAQEESLSRPSFFNQKGNHLRFAKNSENKDAFFSECFKK